MQYCSDYQRKVFNLLAVIGLSQTQVLRERNGSFKLKSSSFSKRIIYIILRINTLTKFSFLVLLSFGLFQEEFEFFEKMAIALWFLIMMLMITSERIWYRKYPFFEILVAWWSVEERIFQKLGRPDQFIKEIKSIAVSRVWFQGIIAVVGILAVAVQYDAAPKYCVFAYSIIESEGPILKWVFGMHEILFLTHAWVVYGSVIYLSNSIGAEFTYTIETLNELLETFVENGHIKRALGPHGPAVVASSLRKRKRFSRGLSLIGDGNLDLINEVRSIELSNRIKSGRYSPLLIIKEYLNIHMVVTQLNNFAAYNFLYMHACSYIQMISDVFQLIMILRMPEASITDAMFFAEDMAVCMYMLFRCFKSMAFLHPASESFIAVMNSLVAMPPSSIKKMDRAILAKIKPTVHTTSFFLGPSRMKVGFVGTAMDVLLQYYICVALWK